MWMLEIKFIEKIELFIAFYFFKDFIVWQTDYVSALNELMKS